MLLAAVVSLLGAAEASAHVVMGTKSLHLRVAEAQVIVRGRVLDPALLFVVPKEKTQRQLVEVEILESIKGKVDEGPLRVAHDGHAAATYRAGDEALFFLKPIGASRELRALAVPGGASHVSGQEQSDAFLMRASSGPVLLSATRALVASEKTAEMQERVAIIRGATLDLLTSGDDRLASAALASLVMAPTAAWVGKADLPRLEALLDDPDASIGFRAGLIAELDRRGLIEGEARRVALLRRANAETLPSAIRALGATPGAAVSRFLMQQLEAEQASPAAVAAEAAIALGRSSSPGAAEMLSRALERPEARVRNAAIRGLGLLNSEAAERVLRAAAESHADPVTQRRARAALRER